MKKSLKNLMAGTAIVMVTSIPAVAVDTQPLDVIPAPAGTAVLLSYTTTAKGNSFNVFGVESDADLDIIVQSARYAYYFDVAGYRASFNIIQPYLKMEGSVGADSLGSASGFGDVVFIGGFWFRNDPERQRYASIFLYHTSPIGSYKADRPLNPGSNRTSTSLQFAASTGIGEKWFAEGIIDATIYTDNTNSNGAGDVLSQDTLYTGQGWLTYMSSPTTTFSAGYGIYSGGDQQLNGVYNGFNSKKQQVRLAATTWVTPTTQVLGQISHDFDVKGGFKQDSIFMLRLMKIF